jgi:hypothetical protein
MEPVGVQMETAIAAKIVHLPEYFTARCLGENTSATFRGIGKVEANHPVLSCRQRRVNLVGAPGVVRPHYIELDDRITLVIIEGHVLGLRRRADRDQSQRQDERQGDVICFHFYSSPQANPGLLLLTDIPRWTAHPPTLGSIVEE